MPGAGISTRAFEPVDHCRTTRNREIRSCCPFYRLRGAALLARLSNTGWFIPWVAVIIIFLIIINVIFIIIFLLGRLSCTRWFVWGIVIILACQDAPHNIRRNGEQIAIWLIFGRQNILTSCPVPVPEFFSSNTRPVLSQSNVILPVRPCWATNVFLEISFYSLNRIWHHNNHNHNHNHNNVSWQRRVNWSWFHRQVSVTHKQRTKLAILGDSAATTAPPQDDTSEQYSTGKYYGLHKYHQKMIPFPVGYTYTANEELSAGFYIFVAIVAFVGALTIAGLLMWHNFRLPKCCFAQRQVCRTIDCFEYNHVNM